MKGLYFKRNNESIEKAEQNSAELNLLAKNNGTEIMLYRIKKDSSFYIYTIDSKESIEFFYILNGTIQYTENNKTENFTSGDYFYVQDLQKSVYFKALDDVKLLYIVTSPVFHYLSSSIGILNDIVKKVEQKDVYTSHHSERVESYSMKIAKKLQFDKTRLEELNFSALFHDVGKVFVPDEILNKPGRLTDEEMDFIKRHPVDGMKIVKDSYYKNVGKIIEQHQERIDGSGYPYGLKGDEILPEAKIIAVADSYDAMTSDRPYRKGMPPEVAIKELEDLAGIKYDKEIVDALRDSLIEEGIIKK